MAKDNDVKMYDVNMPVFFKIHNVFALNENEAKITAFQRVLGKLDVEDKMGLVLICPDAAEVKENESDEAKEFIKEMKEKVKKHD